MKKHFGLTCMAYAYFGFGIAVENFGIKAGLGLTATLFIFISSVVFFGVIVFTSMEKVKRKLYDIEENKATEE